MKKPEITITLEFTDAVEIGKFIEVYLNHVVLENCRAKTIRIRRINYTIVLDFYDVEDKKQIFRYKKLLLSIAKCINDIISIHEKKLALLTQLHGVTADEKGMSKKFEDLSKNYEKLTDHA